MIVTKPIELTGAVAFPRTALPGQPVVLGGRVPVVAAPPQVPNAAIVAESGLIRPAIVIGPPAIVTTLPPVVPIIQPDGGLLIPGAVVIATAGPGRLTDPVQIINPIELALKTAQLETLELGLIEDFDYFKRQAYNKIYLTELINGIFSINHQTFNIMLVDYFNKHFSKDVGEVLKFDKNKFFGLRPHHKITEYINNEFMLCDDMEREIIELEEKLKDVVSFMHEAKVNHQLTPRMMEVNPALIDENKMEFVYEQELKDGRRPPTPYEAKVEELRVFCKKLVGRGLQSMRFQELAKEKFEKIVEELKDIELEEWELKNTRKNALRTYKDTLSRVKNRLKNLYVKRFDKDLNIFRICDLALLKISSDLKHYFGEFGVYLKDHDELLRTTDFKEAVTNYYNTQQTPTETEELILYNPEWPPFRDNILDDDFFKQKDSVRKIHRSFEKLISGFETVITQKEDGLDKFYFETLDNLLTKLHSMIGFLTARIEAIRTIQALRVKNDSHRMTVVYIEHFEIVLRHIKATFDSSLAEGPIRTYLQTMYAHSAENEARNKMIREPFSEIAAKFRTTKHAYSLPEFWADLSMRIYRFSQKFFSVTLENNYIKSFVDSLSKMSDHLSQIYEEIINFNLKEMTLGLPDDVRSLAQLRVNNKDLTKRIGDTDVINFLADADEGKFDSEAIENYIADDNKDYEDYLYTKYVDARQRIYEAYLANRFVELYRIEPINNFARVTFLLTQEEYYLNIPAYFKTTIQETVINKATPFEYKHFPKKVDKKTKPGEHIVEDEPLKVELDREFKYLHQLPEEVKWEQVHAKYFEKLNLEQYINLFLRRRTIIYQGKYYDYDDQIAITMAEGSSITKERLPQVSSIEENMDKGFGYSKYSLESKRKLPISIPFMSGDIVTNSISSIYLLSTKHMITITKSTTEGIPGADAFVLLIATDVFEQDKGVEVKWSYAAQWVKTSWLKPIIESQLSKEIKKNLMDWCQIADEVLRTNKPEKEADRPVVVELDIELPNYRTNPVFEKKIDLLNLRAAIEEEQEQRPKDAIELFKENFQFEQAKQKAIRYGEEGALAKGMSENMAGWDLIPKRLKRPNPDEPVEEQVFISSFDGAEFVQKVNELDDSEKRKAYIILAFIGFAMLSRILF